jgi:hypothetical protein
VYVDARWQLRFPVVDVVGRIVIGSVVGVSITKIPLIYGMLEQLKGEKNKNEF